MVTVHSQSRQAGPGVPTGPADKVTWVVICRNAAGGSYSEYVEGTDLVRDTTAGAIRILDGGRLVREYAAGAWSNFCEWVTAYTDFFNGTVIRLAGQDAPDPQPDTQRVLAAAMSMDTTTALALMKGSLSRPRKSSESDGAVRAPARLPGPRHA